MSYISVNPSSLWCAGLCYSTPFNVSTFYSNSKSLFYFLVSTNLNGFNSSNSSLSKWHRKDKESFWCGRIIKVAAINLTWGLQSENSFSLVLCIIVQPLKQSNSQTRKIHFFVFKLKLLTETDHCKMRKNKNKISWD